MLGCCVFYDLCEDVKRVTLLKDEGHMLDVVEGTVTVDVVNDHDYDSVV